MFVRGVEMCVGLRMAASPGRAFGGVENVDVEGEYVRLVAGDVVDVAAHAEVCARSVYAQPQSDYPVRKTQTFPSVTLLPLLLPGAVVSLVQVCRCFPLLLVPGEVRHTALPYLVGAISLIV